MKTAPDSLQGASPSIIEAALHFKSLWQTPKFMGEGTAGQRLLDIMKNSSAISKSHLTWGWVWAKEPGDRKEERARWGLVGHALRCHHLGWGAAPFLSCTEAVSSEATQQPARPSSHNLWTPVLPDQARRPSSWAQIQTPHLGGPSGVCPQPPGCCWVCSRARLCPHPHPSICLPGSYTVPSCSEK